MVLFEATAEAFYLRQYLSIDIKKWLGNGLFFCDSITAEPLACFRDLGQHILPGQITDADDSNANREAPAMALEPASRGPYHCAMERLILQISTFLTSRHGKGIELSSAAGDPDINQHSGNDNVGES